MIYPKSLQKLYIAVLKGAPNDKPCVTVQLDPFRLFLVSSALTAFKQGRPDLVRCHVKLKQSDYPNFLLYDSWLDCTDIFQHCIHEATAALEANSWRICGELTPADTLKVVAAVKNAPTLYPIQKDLIIAALSP